MKQKFTHLFFGGRAVSQIYEVDFQSRTYRLVGWEPNRTDWMDGLPAVELIEWFEEVDEQLSELGFEPDSDEHNIKRVIRYMRGRVFGA